MIEAGKEVTWTSQAQGSGKKKNGKGYSNCISKKGYRFASSA